jgi:N-acetylglucosamine malate deacetylase 2
MAIDDTTPLFGKILVVVAHQDDETACSVLLQRASKAHVVFATDGAPASDFFWSRYGSRRQYANVRRAEALQALEVIGITDPIFLEDPVSHFHFPDQELFRSLGSALEALTTLALRLKPDVLITPAYEGGHPDHDACSFLVSLVGRLLSIPRWEMPLYHRSPTSCLVHQEFRSPFGGEILLQPAHHELHRRDRMLSKYVSQPDVTNFVRARVERFRPQPSYDYSRPPHFGTLNYEAWGWPITGAELCTAFQDCELARSVAWPRDPEATYAQAGCRRNRSDSVIAVQPYEKLVDANQP